jgi:asparagine synthetase B (glutamine-hydrolysing)
LAQLGALVSGFVGILHVNGTPLERALLEHLTEFQAFRGPDARDIWIDGSVGFGHTLLKTCPESERQPLSLNSEIWIVADCRMDARSALIAELERHGHHDVAKPRMLSSPFARTVFGKKIASIIY